MGYTNIRLTSIIIYCIWIVICTKIYFSCFLILLLHPCISLQMGKDTKKYINELTKLLSFKSFITKGNLKLSHSKNYCVLQYVAFVFRKLVLDRKYSVLHLALWNLWPCFRQSFHSVLKSIYYPRVSISEWIPSFPPSKVSLIDNNKFPDQAK